MSRKLAVSIGELTFPSQTAIGHYRFPCNWALRHRPGRPAAAPSLLPVICLADLPRGELDELLLAAGETTRAAGSLVKGAGPCHGTGGNGYAFLALHPAHRRPAVARAGARSPCTASGRGGRVRPARPPALLAEAR